MSSAFPSAGHQLTRPLGGATHRGAVAEPASVGDVAESWDTSREAPRMLARAILTPVVPAVRVLLRSIEPAEHRRRAGVRIIALLHILPLFGGTSPAVCQLG